MTSRSPNIKFVIRAIFVKKGDKKGKKKTLFYKNIFADFRLGWWAGGWVWAVGPVKKLVPIRPLQCWLQKIHHMATLASRQCPHHAGYSVVATCREYGVNQLSMALSVYAVRQICEKVLSQHTWQKRKRCGGGLGNLFRPWLRNNQTKPPAALMVAWMQFANC